MAFGLFSRGRNDYADVIYTGGKIYTMDDELPVCDAVAVRDGIIMRVGNDEDMQDLVGDDTEVFDLEGMFMLPGFIAANDSPVLDMIDEEVCMVLDDFVTADDILSELRDYIHNNPSDEIYFAYGFDMDTVLRSLPGVEEIDLQKQSELSAEDTLSESIDITETVSDLPFIDLLGNPDAENVIKMQHLLDEVCPDKPVLLLSAGGIGALFNTATINEVIASAMEDEPDFINLPYIMRVLAPLDPFRLERSAMDVINGYCEEGFTTIYEGNASLFLCGSAEDVFLEMIQRDMTRFRYVSGIFIREELAPYYIDNMIQARSTKFSEMDGLMMCGILAPHVEGDNMSADYLEEIMFSAQQREYDVHLEAQDETSLATCRTAIASFREKAGDRIHISLAHNGDLATTASHHEFPLYVENRSATDEIRSHTTIAAEKLGLSDVMGSIADGKYADFVCFEEDPFEEGRHSLPDVAMTVLAGNIAYDAEDEEEENWELLTQSQML